MKPFRTKVLLLEEHLGKRNPLQSEEQHDFPTVSASHFSGDLDACPPAELDDPSDFVAKHGKSAIGNLVAQPTLGALEDLIYDCDRSRTLGARRSGTSLDSARGVTRAFDGQGWIAVTMQ